MMASSSSSSSFVLASTSTSSSSSSNFIPKSKSSPAANSQQQQNQFTECTTAYFNRTKIFFNPPHIRLQAQMDRRFLQRLGKETAHANVNSFYLIDCEEMDLRKCFQDLHKMLLSNQNSSARAYQLILNTLTYYYSKRTWSTSVPKCVFECLQESLIKDAHVNLAQKSLFELELVCLLELFMMRYNAENGANRMEDNVYDILAQIRQSSSNHHLATFVHNTIIPHFGYSMGPTLRSICNRLDLKVKIYRSDPFSTPSNRKSSLNSLKEEGASSEPTHSSSEELKGSRRGSSEEEEEEDEEESTPPMSKVAKRARMGSPSKPKSRLDKSKSGSADSPTPVAERTSSTSRKGQLGALGTTTPLGTAQKTPAAVNRSSPRGKAGNAETNKKRGGTVGSRKRVNHQW